MAIAASRFSIAILFSASKFSSSDRSPFCLFVAMNIRPPNGIREQSTATAPHPSRGGKPYPREIREQVIWRFNNNLSLDTAEINAMRANKKFPCLSTCNSWITQYVNEGNVFPKRHTGNKFADREILGKPLERLALFWVVMPKATYAEARAYLHNTDPSVDVYSDSQLCRAKILLDISRKRASTTADKAHTLENLERRRQYWKEPYPLGMVAVDIDKLIDIDEAAFKLEATNRDFGYAVREQRCSDTGVYGRGEKVTLLMGICSDRNVARQWFECWEHGGTTIDRFSDFIELILDDLRQNFNGQKFVFTMDNLNVHKNPRVVAMIAAEGHGLVFRAPYWPVDGAIEYVFNTIHTHLMEYYNRIRSLDELKNRLILIIGQMQNFHRYFHHVGFR